MSVPAADLLVANVGQLATPLGPGPHRGLAQRALRVVPDAVVAVGDGVVAYAGPARDWRGEARATLDAGGAAVVPGLVDPHTHLVWAGDRLADFEARAAGVPYETILARGGGIRHTVRATAAATVETLVALARPRLAELARGGATTVEIKSGYGFTPDAELRSLEAIGGLRAEAGETTVVPTLLVHVPPADAAERAAYVADVCGALVPEAARRGLATAVDVFVEREAFTVAEADAIFGAARAHGLAVKLHADQFHAVGGVELAVRRGALSVDHLEASGPAQVAALAASATVATVLPGVTLHLGLPPAPGRALVDAGAAVAVGTDCNPGSSPLFSPALALALAVRLNGLAPAEALVAATANAAAALGLADRGWLGPGARADLLVLDAADWRELPYALGRPVVARAVVGGRAGAPAALS
ncbi:imidazolonepropionase [Gemmatimonadetes bacterium T265]|nr:imidazolonepropionase [Gemmatimonadetes bacterium T265]